MEIETLRIRPEVLLNDVPTNAHRYGNDLATLITNANILILHKELDMAAHLLRKALYLDSTHLDALKKLALCLDDERDSQIKNRIYKEIDAQQGTFETSVQLANCLYQQEKFLQSKEIYFRALNKLSDSHEQLFEVYKNLGNIFLRENDFDAAEEFYNKAFAINPNSDVLIVNMATLSFQQGDFNSSITRFRQALELNSKNDKAWVGIGLSHYKMGDHVLAMANIEAALDINPLNRTAVHLISDWGLRGKNYAIVTNALINYVSGVEYDQDMSLLLIHTFCLDSRFIEASLELERMLLWDPSNEKLLQIEREMRAL